MGQLQHPNLVAASDARVEGRWHFVAMELIEGLDLDRLVRPTGDFRWRRRASGPAGGLGLEQATCAASSTATSSPRTSCSLRRARSR